MIVDVYSLQKSDVSVLIERLASMKMLVCSARCFSRTLFVLTVALALGGCAPLFECDNEVIYASTSPDGKHIAIAYDRGCGATTSHSMQVSILKRYESLSLEADGVFIASKWRGELPVRLLAWEGENILKVYIPESPKIFRQERNQGAIQILYSRPIDDDKVDSVGKNTSDAPR